ncbi:MAG: hypothetical protein P0111_04675 [Nitrospira sp.]|nr:hypothetical protein [Nitrospira sp.]
MKSMGIVVLAVLALFVGSGSVATAEEGTVRAAATWKSRSFVFPVGPDQAYLVGVYSGTLYVDDGKGALHAASIVCPATAEGDLKTMTKTGQGRCILTAEDGDRIYARFSCTGNLEGCRGPFKIEGGTGRFAGTTGEGEMISRILVRQMTTVTGFETVEQEGEGVAVWPSLTYRIPEKN